MSDRKPNWTKWKLIPKAKVWQVVALSLDLDPDKVTRGKEDWMAGGAFVNHEGKDFQDRFDVIIANCSYTKDDLLYIGLGGQHTGYGDLNIPKFAQWALSVNLDIPPELEALATHAALSTKEFSYVEREARSNLISSALDVSFSQYEDIFLLDSWPNTKALQYLLGIYELTHLADDINSVLVRTLDCYAFNSNDEKYVTDAFQLRLEKLSTIWQSGNHPDINSPSYYIEWAIKKKQKIYWLDWAVESGFYVPKNEPATKQEAEKPLVDKERGNLYRIIAALSETLLNENSGDITKPHLKNQSKLIEYLDTQYDGYAGVKKSNLETVLAAAKKLLNPS